MEDRRAARPRSARAPRREAGQQAVGDGPGIGLGQEVPGLEGTCRVVGSGRLGADQLDVDVELRALASVEAGEEALWRALVVSAPNISANSSTRP